MSKITLLLFCLLGMAGVTTPAPMPDEPDEIEMSIMVDLRLSDFYWDWDAAVSGDERPALRVRGISPMTPNGVIDEDATAIPVWLRPLGALPANARSNRRLATLTEARGESLWWAMGSSDADGWYITVHPNDDGWTLDDLHEQIITQERPLLIPSVVMHGPDACFFHDRGVNDDADDNGDDRVFPAFTEPAPISLMDGTGWAAISLCLRGGLFAAHGYECSSYGHEYGFDTWYSFYALTADERFLIEGSVPLDIFALSYIFGERLTCVVIEDDGTMTTEITTSPDPDDPAWDSDGWQLRDNDIPYLPPDAIYRLAWRTAADLTEQLLRGDDDDPLVAVFAVLNATIGSLSLTVR